MTITSRTVNEAHEMYFQSISAELGMYNAIVRAFRPSNCLQQGHYIGPPWSFPADNAGLGGRLEKRWVSSSAPEDII